MMKLHHTGFIVGDIDTWEKNMIYETKINDLFDPVQNARLALYKNHSDVLIELIQPMNEGAFTWNSYLKQGNHFNHFCYEVDNEEQITAIISTNRMIKVLGPVPAVLFENRHILFYFNRNRQVVEFLLPH